MIVGEDENDLFYAQELGEGSLQCCDFDFVNASTCLLISESSSIHNQVGWLVCAYKFKLLKLKAVFTIATIIGER